MGLFLKIILSNNAFIEISQTQLCSTHKRHHACYYETEVFIFTWVQKKHEYLNVLWEFHVAHVSLILQQCNRFGASLRLLCFSFSMPTLFSYEEIPSFTFQNSSISSINKRSSNPLWWSNSVTKQRNRTTTHCQGNGILLSSIVIILDSNNKH